MTWLTWVGALFWVFASLAVVGYRLADRPGDDFGRAAGFIIASAMAVIVGVVWVVGKAVA